MARTLRLYELLLDLNDLDYVAQSLAMLGRKGMTGTQASMLRRKVSITI